MYDSIFLSIAEDFLIYLQTLSEEERQEIHSDITAIGFGSVNETFSAYDLVTAFGFFYFVKERFPTATDHTFVPNGEMPHKVCEEQLNIKKLYQKFRRSSSHAIVASQFIAALNVFFDGKSEISRKFLTELYRNLTVCALSTNDGNGFHTNN